LNPSQEIEELPDRLPPQRIGSGVVVGGHVYMVNPGPGTAQCIEAATGKNTVVGASGRRELGLARPVRRPAVCHEQAGCDDGISCPPGEARGSGHEWSWRIEPCQPGHFRRPNLSVHGSSPLLHRGKL